MRCFEAKIALCVVRKQHASKRKQPEKLEWGIVFVVGESSWSERSTVELRPCFLFVDGIRAAYVCMYQVEYMYWLQTCFFSHVLAVLGRGEKARPRPRVSKSLERGM